MKTVILDTDFLLVSLRWKIYVEDELDRLLDSQHRVCILDRTLDELKGKKDEALAIGFIKRLIILPTPRDKSVDELLLAYDPIVDLYVATQDKELKEKLKKRNIPLITIRNKSHLELV